MRWVCAALLGVIVGACGGDEAQPVTTGAATGSGGASVGSGGAAVTTGAGGSGGVEPPSIRFVGRTVEEGAATRFAWSGSGLEFRFTGTDASVRMDDAARYWTVVVDGEVQPPLATISGEQTYPVATGLTDGEHEVRLYRRTEASFGATDVLEVELEGELLAPPPRRAHRMEVIGDSITAGYGNEGPDESCNFSAETENHYLTYGAITARSVDAELHTVAWSGKGVIFNYGDDTVEPLPEVYDRVTAFDDTPYDFSWQPEVVVINLGTNDFSTDGDPSAAQFTDAYVAFLAHLRDRHPDAFLLALVPTLLGGSDLTTAQAYIEDAIATRNAAGDADVASVALSFDQTGWGCDYHPSLATHASMAEALTAELQSRLGW